jgi:hypothetical protein
VVITGGSREHRYSASQDFNFRIRGGEHSEAKAGFDCNAEQHKQSAGKERRMVQEQAGPVLGFILLRRRLNPLQ